MSRKLLFVSALVVAAVAASVTWAEAPVDVETAARAYRIRVYRSFRQNRVEYDRRIERGEEVLTLWRRSGETKVAKQAALMWFLAASEASIRGAEGPLPALADVSVFEPDPAQLVRQKSRSSQPAANRLRTARANRPAKPSSSNLTNKMQGFGQMVGDRVNSLFGNKSPQPPASNPVTAEVTDAEALMALQTQEPATPDPNAEQTVRQINESIQGHNAIIDGIRDQLQSEWDFNPASADELVSKLETVVASELSLAERIAALDPTYQAKVNVMHSANDLIGEIDERFEVLRAGADSFTSLGFDEETAQRLFGRVDELRKQLDY